MAEVELKLELHPEHVDVLFGSDLLGSPAQTLHQHSTYFDTDDRLLFSSGFTLRIRQDRDTLKQTVKATGAGAAIFARSEWESVVGSPEPVLDHTTPLLSEFGEAARDVTPQFAVVIRREVWNVEHNGSKIEVSLDRGGVNAVERQVSIIELELELKYGKQIDLFDLARKVQAHVPVKLGVLSKAERGFRLLDAARQTNKAETIDLSRTVAAREAFQAIAQSCFRQFRLNEAILVASSNLDALHQARVALRRLRSAITLFKPLFPDDCAKQFSDEFRWLAGILGEARNLDVLLRRSRSGDLRERLVSARKLAYDDAIAALASARSRTLMLGFLEWLYCGSYLDAEATRDARLAPVDKFAAEALNKGRKRLKKHGRNLAKVDDEHRHQARKDAKKLRYAAEFLGSLFSDKRDARRHERFIAAMEGLQDELGALNDLAMGPNVLSGHGLREHPEANALLSHEDKDSLIASAQSALDDVLDAKRFWR